MAARPRTLPAAIAPVLVGTAAAVEWAGRAAAGRGASSPPWSARSSSRSGPTSPTTTPTPSAAPTPPTGSGPVRVTSAGLVTPRRVLTATWVAFGVAVACGIYLAAVAGIVILAGRRRLDRRRRPLHGRPAALRLRRPRRGLRLPLLRPGRRQRLLLRAARAARRAAARALDLGRLPRHRDPRRQQRPRHRDRPPGRQDDAGGADGPRATPSRSTGCWCSAPSSCCRSPWSPAKRSLLPLLGLLVAAAGDRAAAGDDATAPTGPALNGALAGDRRPARRLQPAGLRRPADRQPERLGAVGVRLASVEVIPYALPFREPYVTARGTPRAARDGAAAAALRRTGWSGSAKRCRCRCAAGRRWRRWSSELERLARREIGSTRRALRGDAAGALAPRPAARRSTALLDLRGRRAGGRAGRSSAAARPSRSAATRP